MSALPPEADMLIVGINVCYVPQADITTSWVARRRARSCWHDVREFVVA